MEGACGGGGGEVSGHGGMQRKKTKQTGIIAVSLGTPRLKDVSGWGGSWQSGEAFPASILDHSIIFQREASCWGKKWSRKMERTRVPEIKELPAYCM